MNLLEKTSSIAIKRKVLIEMPKTLLPKFDNPLFLADFLQSCLDDPSNTLDLQIYALKALFLLLQNHGLDYANYYKKLYSLLLPQQVDHHVISVFTSVDHATKQRFLRVLDLSLRSPTLPSKLVASFVKRLARVLVAEGVVVGVNDTMFVLSLLANLIKRHPRAARLIHRKKTSLSMGRRMATDPFLHNE